MILFKAARLASELGVPARSVGISNSSFLRHLRCSPRPHLQWQANIRELAEYRTRTEFGEFGILVLCLIQKAMCPTVQ